MSNGSSELLIVLDKLIETQVQGARVTSDLKNAVSDNNEHLKDLHRLLSEVNDHFSNGFRLELREHVTEVADAFKAEHKKDVQQILEGVNCLRSPKMWINMFLFIGALFGLIAGIVTVILKFMGQ